MNRHESEAMDWLNKLYPKIVAGELTKEMLIEQLNTEIDLLHDQKDTLSYVHWVQRDRIDLALRENGHRWEVVETLL